MYIVAHINLSVNTFFNKISKALKFVAGVVIMSVIKFPSHTTYSSNNLVVAIFCFIHESNYFSILTYCPKKCFQVVHLFVFIVSCYLLSVNTPLIIILCTASLILMFNASATVFITSKSLLSTSILCLHSFLYCTIYLLCSFLCLALQIGHNLCLDVSALNVLPQLQVFNILFSPFVLS